MVRIVYEPHIDHGCSTLINPIHRIRVIRLENNTNDKGRASVIKLYQPLKEPIYRYLVLLRPVDRYRIQICIVIIASTNPQKEVSQLNVSKFLLV